MVMYRNKHSSTSTYPSRNDRDEHDAIGSLYAYVHVYIHKYMNTHT